MPEPKNSETQKPRNPETSSLLPSGFYDILPPEAEGMSAAVATLLASFDAAGYRRVAPPLMEFEETLMAGPGAVLSKGSFRVMDSVSKRMLSLRRDHTLQVGRIAATRLADAPRPLRLSYAGPVVRLTPGEQDKARQLCQVGTELIGSMSPEADAEALLLSLSSLSDLGLKNVSADLALPTLIPALCAAENLGADERKKLQHALDRKDETEVARLKGHAAKTALALLKAESSAAGALAALEKMQLPDESSRDRARLAAVLRLVPAGIAAGLTVDLVEYRGFEYQTGLSFSLFSKDTPVELGRGGRYRTHAGEAATGFTFTAEALVAALPPAQPAPRLMVPFGLAEAERQKLVRDGFVLVQGWAEEGRKFDLRESAAAQNCTHVYESGRMVKYNSA